MKFSKQSFAAFSLALGFFMISSAMAQDSANDLPALRVITCDNTCANLVPAKPIVHIQPSAPYTFELSVSALVLAEYVIGVDGKVKSVDLLQVQGYRSFADRTVDAIRRWTFEPAKLNGKPVESTQWYQVDFIGPAPGDGARQDVAYAYNRASELLQAGKDSEAQEALNRAGKLSVLNFYERSMLAYPLAMIAFRKHDYLETRRIIDYVARLDTARLNPATAVGLWELRIESDLLLGDMADANYSHTRLARLPGFDINAPAVKLLNKANAGAEALPVLSTTARIPSLDEGDVFMFNLYRNTFSFQTMSGSLDSFRLMCGLRKLESKITETAQWKVPNSWGHCALIVRGAPGSTFRILQTVS